MSTTFLTGPAGSGKTTWAVQHLRRLLTRRIPANTMLVIVPQRTLAKPFQDVLTDPTLPGSGAVDILTFYGLTLRTINLFWPLAAAQAGFARPQARPVFLTIETTQYYLRQSLDPLLKQGYFDPNVVPVTLSLPRLMSQLVDNLNKAALIGLPHTQVGERLLASLPVAAGGRVAIEHTQACLNHFRRFCLERNLLDFSLQIELFHQHLWPLAEVRRYLTGRYRHLIVDNLEEDTPFAHTILQEWLPLTESALLVYDEEAGYRLFLGANRRTAQTLQEHCDETIRLTHSRIASAAMLGLGERLGQILESEPPVFVGQKQPPSKAHQAKQPEAKLPVAHSQSPDPRRALLFEQTRFYPQMLDWVAARIETLLSAGTEPGNVVILAPFVSDTLRLSFLERMKQRGIPARAHRPSRPLNQEPLAKAMLNLARLTRPEWDLLPQPFDVALTLHLLIADLDPIRANLLIQVVYRPGQSGPEGEVLSPFEQITGDLRERISYQLGARFDTLRAWLQDNDPELAASPLDHFLRRLFGEVLSQPGFAFHQQPETAEAVANLIESILKFRRVTEQVPLQINPTEPENPEFPTPDDLNRAYVELVEQGLVAAQYIASWDPDAAEAVLLTPATTFLMSNRPVDYQFWLDVGSNGWWERIAQPLTHPYILAADWELGRPWTDREEVAAQRDQLYRLVLGLTRRCRKQIIAVNSEISEQGFEQRGQLLITLNQLLRQLSREHGNG